MSSICSTLFQCLRRGSGGTSAILDTAEDKKQNATRAENPCGIDVQFGGAKGARTPDLLTASQALSQLSYSPNSRKQRVRFLLYKDMVFLSTAHRHNHSLEMLSKGFPTGNSVYFLAGGLCINQCVVIGVNFQPLCHIIVIVRTNNTSGNRF